MLPRCLRREGHEVRKVPGTVVHTFNPISLEAKVGSLAVKAGLVQSQSNFPDHQSYTEKTLFLCKKLNGNNCFLGELTRQSLILILCRDKVKVSGKEAISVKENPRT